MDKKGDIEEKEQKKRSFIYFHRIHLLMPLSCLVTLEIEPEWVRIGNKMEQKWSMVLNKGMESTKEHSVGEKKIVYDKMEVCEKEYEKIVEEIGFDRYNVITL